MKWCWIYVAFFLNGSVLVGQSAPSDSGGTVVPALIQFSSAIQDPSGRALGGSRSLTFALYDNQQGGAANWSETQTVIEDSQGRYTAYLGSATTGGIPADLFASGTTQWVGVTPDDGGEQSRVPITTVPYAFKAAAADTFGGKKPEDFVSMQQLTMLLRSAGGMLVPVSPTPVNTTQESDAPIPNLNAAFLNGFPDLAFAKVSTENAFLEPQTFSEGVVLPAAEPESGQSDLIDSAPLDFESSIMQQGTRINQTFQWISQSVASQSGAPTARVALLFSASPAAPVPTGLSFNSDGTINFAPGQTLPSGAVTSALSAANNGSTNPNNPTVPPIVQTSQYYWAQGSTGSVAISVGNNEITLQPCPRGVNGSDSWHYLYISGTGTPEVVLITGGTCVSGASQGTIQFTAVYAHLSGYKIGTATDGLQEAFNVAALPNSSGQVTRTVLIDPGTHLLRARLSVRASNIQINSSGAVLTCAMSDTCLMLGDPSNALAFGKITITGVLVSPGVANSTWPAVEDNALQAEIDTLGPVTSSTPGASFGSMIQVDNDQAATINSLDTGRGTWGRCDASFCSTAIVGPGPFNTNAGVIWVQNSNLALNCAANGIDNQDANTLRVTNTVIEGYPQFGIRSSTTYVPENVQMSGDYTEVGDCVSPLGTGQAGLIVEGGQANVSSTTGPAGNVPQFSNTGSIQYQYYIVVNSSVMGVSPAYLAGNALTSGSGPINVVWNQVGKVGTITYDVLRVVGNGGAYSLAPFGVGTFAVATGLPAATSCANKVCTFVDNAASTPLSYTVASVTNYWPSLFLWPGSVILTTASDMQNTGGAVPTQLYIDSLNNSGSAGVVVSGGASAPSVFAQECGPQGNWSSAWMQCLAGSAESNDYPPVTGTVYQLSSNGSASGGLKGRIIFDMPPNSSVAATHVITLSDSNSAKTMATPGNRPPWDANDSYLGYDNWYSADALHTQVSIGAPVAISQYIANPGDNVHWGERLTATSKTFQVPVVTNTLTVNENLQVYGSCLGSGCGPFSSTSPQIVDVFNRANGSLGANWTVTDGTWSIVNDQATYVEGSDGMAMAVNTGSAVPGNQYAVAQIFVVANGSNGGGVGVRLSSSQESGYFCISENSGGFVSYLMKYEAGAGTLLGIGPAIPSGDYLSAQANNSVVSCLDNGAPIITATDSTFSSGFPGIYGEFNYSATFSNFRAGSLAYSSNGPLSLGGQLNQTTPGTLGNTCTMTGGTSCTLTIANAYQSPVCLVTVQGVTPIAGSCNVSGTTVTITALSPNSLSWGALVFGNPN
jgi:hypothetical protein